MTTPSDHAGQSHRSGLSRRDFLKWTGAGAAGASIMLGGMGLSPAEAHSPEGVIVGIPSYQVDPSPHYIAAHRGYFEEQGLKVQIVDTASGQVAVQRGLSGETVMGNSNMLAWIRSIASGIGNQGILQTAFYNLDHRVMSVVVRKDLWENGEIKEPRDIEGHTFGVHGGGKSSDELFVRVTLEKFGVDLDKVRFQYVNFGDQPSALASKSIDVCAEIEPLLTKIINDGTGVKMPDPDFGGQLDHYITAADEITGRPMSPVAVTWASPDFVEQNPDSMQAYFDAYNKATDFIRAYPDQGAQMISDVTGLSTDVLEQMQWPGYNPVVLVDEIQAIADYAYDRGEDWLRRKVDVAANTFGKR